MLLYPLYASVVAIETPDKLDDEQWLAYWIFYSFLTLMEMAFQHVLVWIPIWYDVKLIFVAWLVLPQFRGAAFIYDNFVRERIIKRYREPSQHHNKSPKGKSKTESSQHHNKSPKGKSKTTKFVHFITPKKEEHEVY
ncbi:HVA22-like protein e isoform X2 [Lycium barbarum]|nr:HVA22-like protein e isoform X2 [Lycium barbarum]